jgi:hypothetical protein
MKSDNPKASPFAAKELLNRGWEQAPRYHEHDGDQDGTRHRSTKFRIDRFMDRS